jgi:hypothetical protein
MAAAPRVPDGGAIIEIGYAVLESADRDRLDGSSQRRLVARLTGLVVSFGKRCGRCGSNLRDGDGECRQRGYEATHVRDPTSPYSATGDSRDRSKWCNLSNHFDHIVSNASLCQPEAMVSCG